MSRPRCSIVIPVFNRPALTAGCIDDVLEHVRAEDEVILVDDGSEELTARVLGTYGQRIRVVARPRNGGYASACNAGAAVAESRHLVFLNNDTIGTEGWLDGLLEYADAHREASIVGTQLRFMDNTIQHAGVVIGGDRMPYHIYRRFPAMHPAVSKSRRFQAVTAACVLIRRERFEELGGFDQTYVNAFEDIDFCLRARELGYETHYCHSSVLFHRESSTRGLLDADTAYSGRVFLERWGNRVEPDDLRYYLEDGLIEVRHQGYTGIDVVVSPLIGRAVTDDTENEIERLLQRRALEFAELRAEADELRKELEDRRPPRVGYSADGALVVLRDEASFRPPLDPAAPATVSELNARLAPLRLDVSAHEPRRVNVLVPAIDVTGRGGCMTALQLASLLRQCGRRVRVISLDAPVALTAEQQRELSRQLGAAGSIGDLEIEQRDDRSLPIAVNPDDHFIATSWWSAHVADNAVRQLMRHGFVYLIDEYEPFTVPMGSFAALARQSYEFPHLAVFASESLARWFAREQIGTQARDGYGGDSLVFHSPIVDPGEPQPTALAGRSPRRVLFYAETSPSHMLELGLVALERAVASGCFGGAWEFSALGALPDGFELAPGVRLECHPRLPPRRYRALLRAHDIGLSLAYTPHPGVVAAEMAAAGMLTVTNTFATKTASTLSEISSNLVPCEPTVAGVMEALAAAVTRVEDVAARCAAARATLLREREFSGDALAAVERFLDREGPGAADRVPHSASFFQ
jgi:GT2 family glycosyltransferase